MKKLKWLENETIWNLKAFVQLFKLGVYAFCFFVVFLCGVKKMWKRLLIQQIG